MAKAGNTYKKQHFVPQCYTKKRGSLQRFAQNRLNSMFR
jgi:hypothetical protein